MAAVVFDGKEFAAQIQKEVEEKLAVINRSLGRKPKLVTIYNPDDPGSAIYTKMKSKKAAELGVEFKEYFLHSTNDMEGLISNLNKESDADGIMIQTPLFGDRWRDTKLCLLIDPEKDVDGLNPRSQKLPATVRGVYEILRRRVDHDLNMDLKYVIIGNMGRVGRWLERVLEVNHLVIGMDKYDFKTEPISEADVVISCTGQTGLIKPEFVKEGVRAIDVGYPKGDFAPEVAQKAAFITPVPGGVGPVTVIMLYNNLADAILERNR